MEFPKVGFGTYKVQNVAETVGFAINVTGYKMLDTAELYRNHAKIGDLINRGVIDRSKIWITTKVSFITMQQDEMAIRKSIEKTFRQLCCQYIDLYLIHAPVKNSVLTWQILSEYQERGLIGHIGLSNFNLVKLQQFIGEIGEDEAKMIFCNQIEYGPCLNRFEIIDFCLNRGICIVAYGMLAGAISSPVIGEIGERLNISPAQVILRWCLNKGVHVIPMAEDEEHIEQNIDLFNIVLSDDDMVAIDKLNCGFSRYERYL